jgi:CDP-diacylglycerol---glycerol-3-phosphate 3-phosphatidyltransferase
LRSKYSGNISSFFAQPVSFRPTMNLPNKLTISRFGMTLLFVVCMSMGEAWEQLHAPGRAIGWNFGYSAAFIFFVLAAVTDFLDGYLARKHQLVTNFGKLMDPLADKIMMAAGFIMLIPLRAIPAWVAIVLISREFLITGLRLLATSRGIVLPSEKLGKHKTLWQIITVCYFLCMLSIMELIRAGVLPTDGGLWWEAAWNWGGKSLLCIAVGLTIWSGAAYATRHRDLIAE